MLYLSAVFNLLQTIYNVLQLAINIYGCNMDKDMVRESGRVENSERLLVGNEQIDLQRPMAFGGLKRVRAGATHTIPAHQCKMLYLSAVFNLLQTIYNALQLAINIYGCNMDKDMVRELKSVNT
ncbi:hypothetical protein Tco_1134873 [Tanacetum coccineum]